ncbi:GIY-YIG nuclease family protein [Granulosicoccus antarcticus]|uniref:Bacteriophage T5 Orf172 DNA-binding domain-containing protein n=1 Tax=Granulosicoccus antarcticus IMCC3135 TaxID=1192854 RepID=A0A2Z2NLN3_9GAMM|nr:GIY-YIG nuclease family protein [Granulosicoccus antarcticus]ASJ70688.1 hypothetical protein IMCC3135_02875 [Granulosicoccus antarcticus IMCC3135]
MSKGYIYAARQPGAREVKIGKTRKNPAVRLGQLNNTSVFKDLEFEFLLSVSDHDAVEKAVHVLLAQYRVRKDREFFRCSPRKARSAIKRAAVGRGRYSVATASEKAIGTVRRSLQLLLGTSLSILGLGVTAVLLFIIYVDPVPHGESAVWMLGLMAASATMLWSGFNLMRSRT